uniref:hypothetical protein n=1 Tax=uncultured Duncaniella sp. TaxID=2768039 RepID=UPI002609A03A
MATLKQRLHKKNASGTYDTIHLETSADLVLMPDGSTKLSDKLTTMDTAISGKAAASHTHTTISGNAGTATKLATARTIRTNLASTATASFDGSGNVTPGVTGILPVANGGTGVSSIDALKKALGVGTGGSSGTVGNADYSDIITGSIGLGTVVTMASKQWLVVHFDTANHMFYMITVDIQSQTQFGSNTTYKGSTIAGVAQTFENNLPAAVRNRLATVVTMAVTSKVFVPTYDQMNGGFEYFNGNSARVANYNGSPGVYWTSSPNSSSDVYYVFTDGGLYGNHGP